MTSSETTFQTVTVVHPMLLLAEPKLGTAPLALLSSGDRLRSGAYTEGFLSVSDKNGLAGFVPAAACVPLATPAPAGVHPTTQLVQPAWLHRRVPPGGYVASPWIVSPQEALLVLGRDKRFLHIQRPDGQAGYVPELVCEKVFQSAYGPQVTHVRQPVALYTYPAPGGQFSSERIVSPKELLLVLGGDSGFLLVQREDGQLGYVPAPLCGAAVPEAIFKIGMFDLGWMGIGAAWALPNLGALLLALRELGIVAAELQPYAGAAVAMAVAATLWFASLRRLSARSFAIGVLLGYLLILIDSRGTLLLWL